VRNLRTTLKKRKAEEPETYIDCDYILATAVDVERLWSLAKNLLTDKRRGMATEHFHNVIVEGKTFQYVIPEDVSLEM